MDRLIDTHQDKSVLNCGALLMVFIRLGNTGNTEYDKRQDMINVYENTIIIIII